MNTLKEVFTEKNYKKFFDFDYVYKGIYLSRLISYLFFVYISLIIYTYYTKENILTIISVTTGVLIFIIVCGKIGEILHLKSIW